MAGDLRAELLADPLSRGYSTMSDQEAADDLNTEYRSRNRTSMTPTEVWQAIDITEFRAKADGDRRDVMGVLQFDSIDPFGNESALFQAIFGASATITALQAARVEAISRAVELEIRKLPVRAGHVEEARV